MPTLSKLETFPGKILDQITISLASLAFLGPPADILSLLLVSKTIWKKIALQNNPHLYARIFSVKFDARAALRRLGDDCEEATELAEELVRRCRGLKRIRADIYPRTIDLGGPELSFLRVDLWMAYLMLIECDGKNAKQLIDYARVDRLALRAITPGGMFHDGAEGNGGWTVDNEVNALTAWLFWLTDKERVQSETPAERQTVIQAFASLFVGSFKYPSEHVPITSFLIPPVTPPPLPATALAFSLAASPISPPCIVPEHFGFEVTLARPLITQAAILSCVVRLEAFSAETSLPLPPDIPTTSAEGIAMDTDNPIREAHDEQRNAMTKFVEWSEDGTTGSERHEHDWMRLRTCYNPWSHPPMRDRVYTPGMLHGLWAGHWFGIPWDDFSRILCPRQTGQSAPHQPLVYSVPMQFRIREHHQHQRSDMVEFDDISIDGTGAGVFNAWLPEGTTMVESEDELRVYVPNVRDPSIYRTFDPAAAARAALDAEFPSDREHEGLYGGGVWDIILKGETDEAFGQAWGHKRYRGRVRDWDGLVVLVREAVENEGQWIFRGYIHGNQNLVGRWRETGTPVDKPGWEGVWSMTKIEG